MQLTLTFDNGPEPDITPGVLDLLARRGIKTTFFVIGEKLADPARRKLAERASDEGHWIGNHTYTHSVPLGESPDPDIAEKEIGRTQALLGDLARPEKLFRPFGGGGKLSDCLFKRSVIDHLTRGGYTAVLWNSIPRDWADPEGWVETALAQCRAQDRTLMVLHDLPTGAMRHLERFLDSAGESGITIGQDFPSDCVPIRAGKIALPVDSYISSLA
jgi:peptidoglycan-N-acetylglucosamine deacetylase